MVHQLIMEDHRATFFKMEIVNAYYFKEKRDSFYGLPNEWIPLIFLYTWTLEYLLPVKWKVWATSKPLSGWSRNEFARQALRDTANEDLTFDCLIMRGDQRTNRISAWSKPCVTSYFTLALLCFLPTSLSIQHVCLYSIFSPLERGVRLGLKHSILMT